MNTRVHPALPATLSRPQPFLILASSFIGGMGQNATFQLHNFSASLRRRPALVLHTVLSDLHSS